MIICFLSFISTVDEKHREEERKRREKEELKKLSRVGSPEWAYYDCIINFGPSFFFSLLFEDRQATGGFCHLGFFFIH